MICSRSVELETKEPLLESSEPSALPLMTFVAEAEEEEGVELPLRNFDPEIMSGGEVRCLFICNVMDSRVATQKCGNGRLKVSFSVGPDFRTSPH